MKQQPVRKRGSGIGAFILLLLVAGVFIAWPMYIDARGVSAEGAITEKNERIRVWDAEWFRSFEIVAEYTVSGQPAKRHANCYVTEGAFDKLRTGEPVTVHYLPNVPIQPFVPFTHLEPCTILGSFGLNPTLSRDLRTIGWMLLGILLLWRVLRIRVATVLLVPWLLYGYACIGLPYAEPEPQKPIIGTATVDSVNTVTRIFESRRDKGIELKRHYQIVTLRYVPQGTDEPVKAVDKVDANSLPNLAPGQSVGIVYDAAHVRVANIQGATRTFVGEGRRYYFWACAGLVLLTIMLWLVGTVFGVLGRAARAARPGRGFAALGRRPRRL